ncbi:MAG TPA: hypothetical protein VNQ79_20430 [Blastocatellia bacterium]|nr:hypothetical protein [Blastocatellia bacterium]
MISSFLTGIRQSVRQWQMMALLLTASLLFAVPVAVPVFWLVSQTSSSTLAAQRMFADKMDALWLIDVINQQFTRASIEAASAQAGMLMLFMGAGWLLLNTFFAGGILEVLGSGDGRFSARRFWAGCGAYFGRFFRLLVVSLIFYGLAYVIYLLLGPSGAAAHQATAYQPIAVRNWLANAALALMFGFVSLIFDYAKISTVVNDRRRMFREAVSAARFALKHFLSVCGLYLLIALIGLGCFVLFAWLRSAVTQASMAAVLLAFILGQLALLARIWARITHYAAALDFYRHRLPPEKPLNVPAEFEPQNIEPEPVTEAGMNPTLEDLEPVGTPAAPQQSPADELTAESTIPETQR